MVRILAAAAVALCCASSAVAVNPKEAELKKALQDMLDGLAAKNPYGMQLAWKSADMEFALAAGSWTDNTTQASRKVLPTDRMLFGSGTKPVTATAVVKLAEQGLISLDDLAYTIIDPVLEKMNGTTLVKLFGADAAKITVRHIVSMQSGVQDFDWPAYDKVVLQEGNLVHPPVEFVVHASQHKQKLICEPGTCVCYSSTNFILAGFILLAKSKNIADWQGLNQTDYLPADVVQRDFSRSKFFTDQILSEYQTVGGISGMDPTPASNFTEIYTQSSTILGFTCGNMVGPSSDMAAFMWDLLHEKNVVEPSYLKQMEQFKPLSKGWAVGRIQYGIGLMIQAVSINATFPPVATEIGAYIGHGGDTYGFLSEQGYYPALDASVAVSVNEDDVGYFAQLVMACNMLKTAYPILNNGKSAGVRCLNGPMEGPSPPRKLRRY